MDQKHTKEPCPTCEDTGWVCECHGDRAWAEVSVSPFACGSAAADPCPICNVPEGDEPPKFPPAVEPTHHKEN